MIFHVYLGCGGPSLVGWWIEKAATRQHWLTNTPIVALCPKKLQFFVWWYISKGLNCKKMSKPQDFEQVSEPKKAWRQYAIVKAGTLDSFRLWATLFPSTTINSHDEPLYSHWFHWAFSEVQLSSSYPALRRILEKFSRATGGVQAWMNQMSPGGMPGVGGPTAATAAQQTMGRPGFIELNHLVKVSLIHTSIFAISGISEYAS